MTVALTATTGVPPATRLSPGARWLVVIVLGIAVVLRVMLVFAGGQDYWPDEDTANPGHIYESLISHNWSEVINRLSHPDRPLFKIVGVIPAAIGTNTGYARTIDALFFGMASVTCIGLIAAIARRLGAGDIETVLAAACLAASTSFLYWARHVTSYDLAMAFALSGLYVGVARGSSLKQVFACGVLAGCSFLSYPGYWVTGAAVALVCVLHTSRGWRQQIRGAAIVAAGVMAPIAAFVVMLAAFGHDLFAEFVRYSGSITEGAFAEGWSLPFEYLWHAEHLLLVAWLACAAWWVWRPRTIAANPRLRAGMIGVGVIYGMLAISSTVLHRFVVYGRLSRQLVPFLCLVTAYSLAAAIAQSPRWSRAVAVAVIAALAVQAAINFRGPFSQTFPSEFIANHQVGLAEAGRYEQLIWVNTRHLYPGPDTAALPPHALTLATAQHPLAYLPYQYEGFTAQQRHALRAADIRMRLIGVLREPSSWP